MTQWIRPLLEVGRCSDTTLADVFCEPHKCIWLSHGAFAATQSKSRAAASTKASHIWWSCAWWVCYAQRFDVCWLLFERVRTFLLESSLSNLGSVPAQDRIGLLLMWWSDLTCNYDSLNATNFATVCAESVISARWKRPNLSTTVHCTHEFWLLCETVRFIDLGKLYMLFRFRMWDRSEPIQSLAVIAKPIACDCSVQAAFEMKFQKPTCKKGMDIRCEQEPRTSSTISKRG